MAWGGSVTAMLRRLVVLVCLGLVALPISTVSAQQTQTVEGVVVDDLGQPIEGARVWTPSASVLTAADGSFTVTDDEPLRTLVQSAADGYSGGRYNEDCLCFDPGWVLIDPATPTVADVRIVMLRNAEVTGVVREADTGEPVEGACFAIRGTFSYPCRGTSGSDGAYSLSAPVGVEITLFVTNTPAGYLSWSSVPRTFAPGSSATLDVEFEPQPWLTALVTDELGEPVAGLPIGLYSSLGRGSSLESVTTADGRVRFARDQFLDLDYTVAAMPDDGRSVRSGVLRLGTPGDAGSLIVRPGESGFDTTDVEGDGATPDDPIEITAALYYPDPSPPGEPGPGSLPSTPLPVDDGPGLGSVPSGYQPLPVTARYNPIDTVSQGIGDPWVISALLEVEIDASIVGDIDLDELIVVVGRSPRLPCSAPWVGSCSQPTVQADGDVVITVSVSYGFARTVSISVAVPVPAGPVEIGGWEATPHRATVPAGLTRSTLLDVRSTDLDGYGEVRSITSWVRFPGERVVFGGGSVPVELDASSLAPGVHVAAIEVLDIDGVASEATFEVIVE